MIFFRNFLLTLTCLLPTISMAAQDEFNALFELVRESRQEQQTLNKTREKQFLTKQKLQQQQVNALKKTWQMHAKSIKNNSSRQLSMQNKQTSYKPNLMSVHTH